MQTYEVNVHGSALRTIKVRAGSGREALDKAQARIRRRSGPWTIDFAGSEDEHFTVYLDDDADGAWQGPDSQGGFKDEPEPEEVDE